MPIWNIERWSDRSADQQSVSIANCEYITQHRLPLSGREIPDPQQVGQELGFARSCWKTFRRADTLILKLELVDAVMVRTWGE